MAIPDTKSVSPVFLADEPDWSMPFRQESRWRTDIMLASSMAEQRASGQSRPRFRVVWFREAPNASERSRLRIEFWRAQKAPLVAPLWFSRHTLASMGSTTALALTLTVAAKPEFHAGRYVILYDSGANGKQVRRIASVSGVNLTLEATVFHPSGAGAAVYQAGDFLCPCILGIPAEQGENMIVCNTPDEAERMMDVEEL